MEGEPFRVAVIIPALNERPRIGAAIAAIRTQTEPPFEIIVVDDGSTDGTSEVARGHGVRVITQANGGVGSARNAGLRSATAPWAAFCDADDRWHPEFLAAARRAHEVAPHAGLIFSDHRTEIDGVITSPSIFELMPNSRASANGRPAPNVLSYDREALARALPRANFIATSSVVVRRSVVLDNGIFFAPPLPRTPRYLIPEDIEWYLRLLVVTDAVATDRALVTYVRREGSASENSGRLEYGLVKLGELVAAEPSRYAPGVAAAFAAARRGHLRGAGMKSLRDGRYPQARQALREAQALQFRPVDEVVIRLSALAELPGAGALRDALRSLWRSVAPAMRDMKYRARR